MEEEYRPNSHRSKEKREEHGEGISSRKAECVVQGSVKQRKKSGLAQAGSIFLPGDVSSVKDYILMDVLVPSVKRAISDIVCNGINMLLGETSRSRVDGARVSYRQYGQSSDRDRRTSRAYRGYDDLEFDNRGDAEEVLYRMEELLERFDSVSVADLLDLAGVTSNYTDNKYGWTDLRSARVERVSGGGYVIRLPRATAL